MPAGVRRFDSNVKQGVLFRIGISVLGALLSIAAQRVAPLQSHRVTEVAGAIFSLCGITQLINNRTTRVFVDPAT